MYRTSGNGAVTPVDQFPSPFSAHLSLGLFAAQRVIVASTAQLRLYVRPVEWYP